MRHLSNRVVAVVALSAALGGAAPALAQQFRAAAPDSESSIDPDAVAALEKMGAYLRTLTAFQVRAEITDENVLLNGEKVQLAKVADLVARKPDGLRLDVTSDREKRLFLFDGKTFTLFAPRMSYYASVAAPPTIAELADRLEAAYGIDLPFVDLFRWGTPASNIADITGATDIGPGTIDGVTCEQYAFRQAGLDWQIWIQEGAFPLPRKLVITTLTDDARPQHVSVFTWNLAPSFDSSAFTFVPPKDAKKIKFADVTIKGRSLKAEEQRQ